MNINIDVYDIASQKEVKEAVLGAIKELVVRQFGGKEENLNRLLVNLSYSFVWEMVDRQFSGTLEEQLKAKIGDIVDGLSAFSVFRRKDAWDKQDSVAYIALQEEMANARPLIKARVEKIIGDYPFAELQNDEIGDVVYRCVMDRLFAPRGPQEDGEEQG